MNTNFYNVIMAGGIGSRLWPLSTAKKPKQFCDVLKTGKSLLQHTYRNFNKIIPAKNILIATHKNYLSLTQKQLPKLNLSHILLEPESKNTAPCILYSTLKIYQQNPNAIIVVSPADHWIKDTENFNLCIAKALNFCSKNNNIVTLGVTPTEPNTQYGYIKFESSENTFKKVLCFTEKPNSKNAALFFSKENYLWNSGILIFSAKTMIEEFKNYLPSTFKALNNPNYYNTLEEAKFIKKNYLKTENISIDYGILEKSKKTYALPTSFYWNDLGSWEAVSKELKKDKNNNSYKEKGLFLNAKKNTIYSTKKVIISNLSNLMVIEDKNTIYIYSKKEKDALENIKKHSYKQE